MGTEREIKKVVYDEGQGQRAIKGYVTDEGVFIKIETLQGGTIRMNKKIVLMIKDTTPNPDVM
jgi:hypothetical protein